MRVLGFLTGAALVIGAMAIGLGSPQLRDEQTLAHVEVLTERLELPAIADKVAIAQKPVADVPPPDAPAEPVTVALPPESSAELLTEALSPDALAEPAADFLMPDAPAEPVAEVGTPARPVADVPLPDVLQGPEWSPDESLETAASLPASVEPASPAAVLAAAEVAFDATPGTAAPAAPAHDSQWQSIWNPFRSQIAANGFAARLSAVTDIDYRVVRLKPGTYQVAFAYADDSERAAKLAQIQGATGLDLPEALP